MSAPRCAGYSRTKKPIRFSAELSPSPDQSSLNDRVPARHQHSIRVRAPTAGIKGSIVGGYPRSRYFVPQSGQCRLNSGKESSYFRRQNAERSLRVGLKRDLSTLFSGRTLDVTRSIAEHWGTLDAQRQIYGRPLNMADAIIAATASKHRLTLVTRKVRDYADIRSSSPESLGNLLTESMSPCVGPCLTDLR